MALLVNKFGGTSVGSIERIEAVADIIIRQQQQGHQLVCVVSAMAGETNRLLSLAQQVDNTPSARELDVLVSTGEQVTASILAMCLVRRGYPAISLLGDQLGIITTNLHGKARIEHINTKRLQQELEHGRIVIAAGFQGRDSEGNITTLGRGGSDTSAVALAGALRAQECLIYTDVDGVYTTDPRVEPNARRIDEIHVSEMLELASLGAKVLQICAVEAAAKWQVPLRVLSSFAPDAGTLIHYKESTMQQGAVTGVAAKQSQALIQVKNCDVKIYALSAILELFAKQGIELDVINQVNHNVRKVDYAISVPAADLDKALSALAQCELIEGAQVESRDDLSMLSVVGAGLKSDLHVTGRFFKALADENIDVFVASTGEIKVSALIERKYMELGVRALHVAFLNDANKTKN